MLFSFFQIACILKIYFLRYAVAFTSSLAPSHENLTIGDKVSTKEKPLHKFDLEEPAPQQTKRNPENSLSCDEKNSRKNKCSKEESQSAQCHKLKKRIKAYSDEKSGIVDSITIVKVVKSEYSEIGPTPKVEVGSEYCEIVPRVKEESEHFGMVPSAEVKSEYSEIFPPFEEVKHQSEEFVHISKGTLNLQVPSRLVGVWVAFDSTFLPTLNTVFVFRLNKDGQVLTNTLILQLAVLVSWALDVNSLTPFYLQVDILCKSATEKNKNVFVSKYNLHFSTSTEEMPKKKLLPDKVLLDMVALERSLEGLPNKNVPLDKDLCTEPLLRYQLSIVTNCV